MARIVPSPSCRHFGGRNEAMSKIFETDVAPRAAKLHAELDPGDGQPDVRVPFNAPDPDYDDGKVDIVAGGEFVDDLIREGE